MNRRFVTLAVVPVLAAFAIAAAPAKKPASGQTREQKVRHLLDLTGAAAMGNQMLDMMISQVEQNPETPKGFADKFRALAAKDDLIARIVPIYAKHLTDADLDGSIAFYESTAGKDLAKAQPLIVQESVEVGKKWGADLAQAALDQLDSERNAGKKDATPK